MSSTEKLIANLAQDAIPVKPAPHPFLLGAKWLAWVVVYLALSLAFSGLRPDLMTQLQSPLFVIELVLLAAIIISTLFSAALLAFPDMHQKRRVAYAPIWMMALFILVMILSWRANIHPSHLSGHSVKCLIVIASLTLLPAAWIFYAMRKLASTHPYLAGSIALLSAFSIGALSLRLSEQTDSILHVMQWHYLPMIGVGILGLVLGRLLLKW